MVMTPYLQSGGKTPGSSHTEEKKIALVLLTRYLKRKYCFLTALTLVIGETNQSCIHCVRITFKFAISIFKT